MILSHELSRLWSWSWIFILYLFWVRWTSLVLRASSRWWLRNWLMKTMKTMKRKKKQIKIKIKVKRVPGVKSARSNEAVANPLAMYQSKYLIFWKLNDLIVTEENLKIKKYSIKYNYYYIYLFKKFSYLTDECSQNYWSIIFIYI